MFDFIGSIGSITELMQEARHSSCPECAGVEWDGTKFIPCSSMADDQFMAEQFNKRLAELLTDISGSIV